MEMVKGSIGWLTMVNEFGVFTHSRLEADPQMKDLAESFIKRQEELERKGNAFNQAQRTISALEAQMVKADYDLDNTVRDLYFSKLGACGNNKKDPAVLRWFPDGLTALIRCRFDEEAGKVTALIGVLSETPDDPVVARILPNLQALLETYQKSIAGLKAAITAASNAWELVEAEKINWLVAYSKCYGDVLAILNGDKRSADTFFKKVSKPPKDDGDAPPEPPKA